MFHKTASRALLMTLSFTWGCANAAPLRPGASFALIGDTPYGSVQETRFDQVIADVNAARNVRFVLHVGDVKAGSERCDDALLRRRFDQFQTFADGFVITPGDNDWTDCHRTNNGNYLPTERLATFRTIFFPQPGLSTGGQPFPVGSQAAEPGFEPYVENVMWRFNGALIATVHVVGSNNGLDPWNQLDPTDSYETPRADRLAEFDSRLAAALAWIDQVFAGTSAQHTTGVLIAMQANPNFDLPATDRQRQGFNAILDRIGEKAIAFGKPVVIAHGDSHYFRIDKPLRAPINGGGAASLERVTRVESFGSPQVHWVEVFVDPRDQNVFRFEPRIVDANVLPR